MNLGLGSKRKRGKVVDTGYPTGLLVEKTKKAWWMAKGEGKWTYLLVEKGKKVGTGEQVNRVSPALDLLASHSIRWLYTKQKWDQPRYPLLMFVAPSRSYVMPLVKCSNRTVKSKDTLNQCCFQCNASNNMNQWHFFMSS